MKKNILSILLIALLMPLIGMAKGDKKEIVILHTNDSHSCIYPLNENLADTLLAGRGGYLRRINMLKQERKECPNLLLLDSGDFSQGSSYYTLFKGDVEVELMNQMGYDVGTIGNHEFDFGLENMARLFRKAKFPIVCANYDFTGTPVEGLVKPYVILKRDGVKIGVFGLGCELDGMVDQKNYGATKFLDPVETARRTAEKLKKEEKCDVIICLSHLGWNMQGVDDDAKLIKGVRYVDIVLGGHSHSYFKQMQYVKDLDGNKIPDDQNGKHALFVGKIKLTLE